jgi:hypothetical protein
METEIKYPLFVTKRQLSRITGLSIRTIERRTADTYLAFSKGQFPAHRVGRRVMYFVPEIIETLGIEYSKYSDPINKALTNDYGRRKSDN